MQFRSQDDEDNSGMAVPQVLVSYRIRCLSREALFAPTSGPEQLKVPNLSYKSIHSDKHVESRDRSFSWKLVREQLGTLIFAILQRLEAALSSRSTEYYTSPFISSGTPSPY